LPPRREADCATGIGFATWFLRLSYEKATTLLGEAHMDIGTIISWAVFGLVIGLFARLLYPGRQSIGFIATMILGIVGSLLGGFISYVFGFHPELGAFRGGGWIMSIVGALIVVWLGLFVGSQSASGMRPMR
jgi:uncharacterized membrane protein YeaQ/YmgE (transglycosylase-associated protein family)